jgi:hypothetical protein
MGRISCRQVEDIVVGRGEKACLRGLHPALEPAERGFDRDLGSIDPDPRPVQLISGNQGRAGAAEAIKNNAS